MEIEKAQDVVKLLRQLHERDLARWANRAWLFKSMDFADFMPRKGFCCKDYLF